METGVSQGASNCLRLSQGASDCLRLSQTVLRCLQPKTGKGYMMLAHSEIDTLTKHMSRPSFSATAGFGALSLGKEKSVADLYSMILNPMETGSVDVTARETPESYLQKCTQNIKAEIWGMCVSKVRDVFSQWRDKLMDKVYFNGVEAKDGSEDILVVAGYKDQACSKAVDLRELRWNLVVWGNSLHLLLTPGKKEGGVNHGDALMLRSGRRVKDRFNSGGSKFFHVVGYVQPYFAELSAIRDFQIKLRTGKDPMLSVLAAPGTRGEFMYKGEDGGYSTDMVPINELQRTIIGGMGCKIECIQGPPGTGKSTTIFHVVKSAIPSGYHAIVTCVQNKALDSIAEKLGPTGMPFIVYGNPSRLGDCAERFTLKAQVERDPAVMRVRRGLDLVSWKRGLVLRGMRRIVENWFDVECKRGWTRLWEAWVVCGNHEGYAALVVGLAELDQESRLLETTLIEARLEAKLQLEEASLASLSTMDGLCNVNRISTVTRKSVVIIDEAGTVPEYKMPLLLSMGVEAIVAIGDQNQLQPFSHEMRDGEKRDGFFQRAVKAIGVENVPMLKEQYRMHPAICELVSTQFYGGKLVTAGGVEAQRRGVVGGGVSWITYPEEQAESPGKLKKHNPVEVDIVGAFMCDELPDLLAQGKSVAVITFYRQQFVELKKMGEAAGFVRTREEMAKGGGEYKNKNFRIVTVDAAQGSEADVVMLSCVRCNRKKELGFITDKNRLCVALSRARERLIVVGSRQTLSGNPVWRAVAAAADMA